MLKKVISGAQTGVDLAALDAANMVGLLTGGTMPFGFKNHDGVHPDFVDKYGITCSKSSSYAARTRLNVGDSDGTLRIARNLNSKGEICTMKSIKSLKKPYFDIDLNSDCDINLAIRWLISENISILNVAGNSERTAPGIYKKSFEILHSIFKEAINV